MIFLLAICSTGAVIVKVLQDVEGGLSLGENDPSSITTTGRLNNLDFMNRPENPSAKTANYTAGKLN